MKNKINLNFGAGNPVERWVNLDSSPYFIIPPFIHKLLYKINLSNRSKFYQKNNYKYFKLTTENKLPFANSSLNSIYCSHVLEHLSIEENTKFIEEARRTLIKGGILRIIVPDLESKIVLSHALFSIEKNLLTLPQELKKNKLRGVLEALHGFPSFHKTLFVKSKIKKIFSKNWTVKLNLEFMKSSINKNDLAKIEQKSRTINALVFELIKK